MESEKPAVFPVIWWAMVLAQFVYAGIVLFVLPQKAARPGDILQVVFPAVALADVIAAQVFWARQRGDGAVPSTASTGSMNQMVIAIWGLDSAPGCLGLILAILGASLATSLGLIALSLVALVINGFWGLPE